MPFQKFITQMFQVLIHVCLFKSYDIQCPNPSQWNLRAQNGCNTSSQYYCLFDENSFMYTEFCKKKPDFEGPGYKVVILGGIDGRMCSSYRYQPFIFWTNGSSECTFQKSLCREEGQMIVTEQSTTEDVTCGCDYTKGYTFVIQPKHTLYCVPSEEDCSCYKKQCLDGYKLNTGYQCKAISASFNGSTTSNPIMPSKNKSTELEVLTDNKELNQNDITRIPSFTILIILALILSLLIMLKYYNIVTVDDKQQMHVDNVREETHEDTFIRTEAFWYTYHSIIKSKIIVVSGPPGCGKTTISYHAALELEETDNYSVRVISNPMKIIDSINIETKQIFVIDDIVGKYFLNDYSLHFWRAVINDIKPILSKSSKTKLILTCRSVIYRNEKFSLLKLPHIHCDMLAIGMSLKEEERRSICRCYVSAEETHSLHENVIMLYSFLPLICKRYKGKDKKSINDYFTYPYDIIENEMNELRLSTDPCFIALGLLVICNNNIDKDSLTLYDKKLTTEIEITDVLNDMLQDIDYGYFISLKGISASLLLLENIYLSETALTFTCINNFMFEMLVGTVGRHFIPCILKHSNSKFIKDYIELAPFTTDRNPLTIKIESQYEKLYFRRIIDDITNGFNWNVFDTVQMKRKEYRLFFLENILKTEKPTFRNSKTDGSTPLHVTSLLGYNDLSFFFIETDKSQVNSRDNTGKTPLHMACLKGNIAVAKILIMFNAEVNQMDTNKVTPFMLACSSGHNELIKFLLTKDVHINSFSSFGYTSLLEACIKNNVKVCSLLLEHKAKVDCFNKNGDTPLHLACQSGQTDILNLLIKYDMKSCINKPNVTGYTPFYLAISNKQHEMAKTIIKYGADPNRPNDDGLTPLHITSLLGYSDLSSFLMDTYKTQITSRDNTGKTPLHMACSKGNAVVAKLLIKYNTEVDQTDNDKVTPFMLACSSGNIELVEFLLTKDVDINAINSFGSSPLLEACVKDDVRVFSLLLDNKAKVDCFDKNGDSPLHLACKAGQTKILNLLINYDLNTCINKPNVKGNTPFYLAISNRHNEIAKTIVKYGADPNYQNEDGLTPLHIACETNASEIVKILLEQYHVESNKKDNKGRTPLDVSTFHDYTDISKLLIERVKTDENIVSIPVTSSSTC